MSTNRHNYECWFKRVVQCLYSDANGGFAILMIAIPLLERYLREKSGVHEAVQLSDNFYDEFLRVFPSLPSRTEARQFWHVYRNGLLHQVTLSRARNGTIMPAGWLSGDAPALHLEPTTGEFWVNPKKFSETVINVIDNDFPTFEGTGSVNHPISIVIPPGTTSSVPAFILSAGTGNACITPHPSAPDPT